MIRHLERPKKNLRRAIAIILLADVMAASQAILVKLATPYFSVNFLVFSRFSVNLLFLVFWIAMTQGRHGLNHLYRAKAWKYQAVRSIGGIAAVYLFYYGLKLMAVAPATLLYFTFPIFIPIVARIWLKVELIHRLWWGIAISFAGIIFTLGPGEKVFDLFAIIPLVGAVITAITMVTVRVLHYTDQSKTILACYFTTAVIVSGLVYVIFNDMSKEIFTSYSLILAGAIGIFASLFQTFFTLAPKYAPARFLSPFIYVTFIFTALADVLILNQKIHFSLILGFLLITIGAVFMVFLYPKEDLKFKPKFRKN